CRLDHGRAFPAPICDRRAGARACRRLCLDPETAAGTPGGRRGPGRPPGLCAPEGALCRWTWRAHLSSGWWSGNPASCPPFGKARHLLASNGRLKTIQPFDRGEDAMRSTVISLTHTLKVKAPKLEFQVTAAIAVVLCAALTANVWL